MSNKEQNKTKIEALNGVLANEFGLFTKTLNYHWNVVGPRFHAIHTFLEGQYRQLLEVMDDVAERARILGGPSTGTVKELLAAMQVHESAGDNKLSCNEMLADLVKGHERIQEDIRATLTEINFKDDPSTEDFLIGTLQSHEKMNWMLNSHLE